MKRNLSILPILALLLSFLSCKKDYDIPVATLSLTENERVVLLDGEKASVIFGGTCTYQGTIDLMTLKIGTTQALTDAISFTSTVDSSCFSFRVDSLSLATTYYYCYLVDYGVENDYQTDTKHFVVEGPAPATVTVTTDSVTNVSYTTAVGWGSVLNDSLTTVTERGFCWSLEADPDLSGSYVTDQENGSTVDSTVSVQFSVLMSDLISDTLYYARAYAKVDAEVYYGEETSFRTLAQETPEMPVVTVDSINGYTVFCTVIEDGGSEVTLRGVCLSQNSVPTVDDLFVACETGGTGSFSCSLSDLQLEANTTYRLRAFATNEVGTAYSQTLSFTTPQGIAVPQVTILEVADVATTTATVRSYVVTDGGAAVTARGVCWGTSMNPTLSNSHTQNGTGIGPFTSNLSGLTPGTTYYVRAYATNEAGTAYSDQKIFVTSNEVSLPVVTTNEVEDVTETTAICSGEVSADGGSDVIEKGVCWSINEHPTLDNYFKVAGTGVGEFSVQIEGLTPGTTYYVRAFATNSVGTAYGDEVTFETLPSTVVTIPTVTTNEVTNIEETTATCGGNVTSDGGAEVTDKGVCWSTSPEPTISDNFTNDGDGIGAFFSELTGLTPGTTYYVRAYATNNQGTAYGDQKEFTTASSAVNVPTVTTNEVTEITQTTATCGGIVTSDGGADVTQRGVCWGTKQNPTVVFNHHTNDGAGMGEFISSITELEPGVTYHVRAYAINSEGVAYGEDVEFTTLSEE